MKKEIDRPITVLISSENHITRSGLRWILESQSSMIVLGELSTGNTDQLLTYRGQYPDILLLDLSQDTPDTFALISKAKKHLTGTAILVMVDLGDDRRARKAMDLGATGIVLRTQSPSVLIAFIESHSPRRPEHVESPAAGPFLKPKSWTYGKKKPQADHTMSESLTDRERSVVALIASGLKNKEIGEHLHISDITVRHHLTNIFTKLGVSGRQKLLILAHQHGLAKLALNREAS
jgi:DNA-binding NarL/FixJ family response regulator